MPNKPERWVDFPVIFLLITVQWCAVSRLVITEWTDNLIYIRLLAMIGILLGGLFGYSRFSSRTSFWLLSIYSLICVPWLLITTLPQEIELLERLASLWGRLTVSLNEFASNKPVYDPILFYSFMAALFWLASLLNGYHLIRYAKPWIPIAITIITALVIEYYDTVQSIHSLYIFLLLFFVLLLIGRIYHIHLYKEWRSQRVKPDSDFGFYLSRTIAIGGFFLILMTWNLPGLIHTFSDINTFRSGFIEKWNDLRNRLSNAFTSLGNRPRLTAFVYSDQMRLGSSASLSESVIFRVEIDSSRPWEESMAGRFYWQARSYDYYDNGEWRTTGTERDKANPDKRLSSPTEWLGREIFDLTIYPAQPLEGTIYSPSYPVYVSRPVIAIIRPYPDDSYDIVGLTANPPMRAGDFYKLKTSVSAPTAQQLASAGEEYPAWITAAYLQLPDNLSERMKALAESLSKDKNTPFEKAVVVTNYLRSEITYQESVPTPPAEIEPLDWFLFDYKAGFCNYYASAEVILLRIMGIPARIAVGYAEGSPNQQRTTFIVREKDSHAWPEVYFPNIGWVEFEPTTSQPFFEFPEERIPADTTGYNPNNLVQPSPPPMPTPDMEAQLNKFQLKPKINWARIWLFTVLILALIILIGLPASWYWQQSKKYQTTSVAIIIVENLKNKGRIPPKWIIRWANYDRLLAVERQFSLMKYILIVAGIKTKSQLTPREQVELLIDRFPQVEQPALQFLEIYNTVIYSPNPQNLVGKASLPLIIFFRVLIARVSKLLITQEESSANPEYIQKRPKQ